MKNRSP
jgi:hypothetical protein